MYEFAERLARLLLWAATLCGLCLTLFVAISAIMRYFLGSPFAFTEELVGLLFSALVFLAFPYVTLKGEHIEVSLVTMMLPEPLRKAAYFASQLLVVLFCVWFGYFAYDFALFSFELGSQSDMANLPLWPWMSLMAGACLLMGVFTIFRLCRSGAGPAGAKPHTAGDSR